MASKSEKFPKPPFPPQSQDMPGSSKQMQPPPDYGEDSYRGANRLKDKKALITGADSGIGRAVALAFAREGADVVVSYLCEDEDARETERLVTSAGRRCLLVRGDIADPKHCRQMVQQSIKTFSRLDILVNNAAHQTWFESLEDITEEEWNRTLATNLSAMFHITQAAVPHMPSGSSIINTASVNADMPNPNLLVYAMTKGAIQNFSGGLAQLLAEKGIRCNTVAPGPVWTPLIPGSMPPDYVKNFGSKVPMQRPGQPCEVAPVYVLLASEESSYVSGATVAVTGGKPIL